MKTNKKYIFQIHRVEINEIIEWCEENLGPRNHKCWEHSNSLSYEWICIYINNIEHAMAFKLRWI